MKKYRAAVLGCGRIGSLVAADRAALGIYSHTEAYAACPGTELVAVGDSDAGRLAACAEQWGVPARYRSAEALLAEAAVEIVSICTPDATHFALASAALDAPATRAILLEKPLALALEDARTLVARARERGVVLAVNYSRRYAASHAALRDALVTGALGRVQTVAGFYTKGVIHNGTHWFDLARFLVGEVTRVSAFGGPADAVSDPTLDVRLEFASGATAWLQGCDAGAFAIFEMDVVGTAGRVRLVDSGHAFESFRVADSPHYAGYRALARSPGITGGLRDVALHAVEDIVACLDQPGRVPRCSGDDALAALRIALAACESAESGAPVDLAA